MSILGSITIKQLLSCLQVSGKIGNDLMIFEKKGIRYFISKVTRCSNKIQFLGIQIPLGQDKENLLLYLKEMQGQVSMGFFKPQLEKIYVEKEQEKQRVFENYVFESLTKNSQFYHLQNLMNITNSKNRISFTVDQQKFILKFQSDMQASRWLDLMKMREKTQNQKQQIIGKKQKDQQSYQLLQPQQPQQKSPLNNQDLGQKNAQIQKLINQKQELKVEIIILKQQFDKFKYESQEGKKNKEQKIKFMQRKNQALNSSNDELKNYLNIQVDKFLSLRAQSEHENKQKQQKIDTLQRENQAMKDTIQKVKKQLQEKEQILNAQLALRRITYQTQLQEQTRINQQNALIIQKYEQNKLYSEELKKQQISQKNQKISELEQQIKDLSSENARYISKLQDLENNFRKEKTQLHQIIKLEQQTAKANSILKQNQRALHIFQGNVLHGVSQEKIYLKQSIQSLIKKQIEYFKLIFKYDPFNPTSFHHYVDEHPNICAVIKLKNGRFIAGFSVSPLSEKTVANQGGIICSLTEKKTYKLCEGKRSVTYDKFFLIFGNSELRLKQGEVKFFTNFGIANSFYDSNGDKYTVLNGAGTEREVIYENFEVFEVFFK